MGMIKQNNARKAEKSSKEILDNADNNANGRVELKVFKYIPEANGIEVSFRMLLSLLTNPAIVRWMKQTLLTLPHYPMQIERLPRKT